MKCDMDLVRLILLEIEKEYRSTAIYNLTIEGYDIETVAYHCKIIYEAGLITDYKAQYASNKIYGFGVGSLTWDGNDFLEKIRDNSQWGKIKDTINQKGLPMVIDTIKSIANAILNNLKTTSMPNMLKAKIEEFIRRGEKIRIEEIKPVGRTMDHVSGPKYDAWMGEIKIFSDRYLYKHPLNKDIVDTYFFRKSKYSACDDMLGHLRALASDNEFLDSLLIGVVLLNPIPKKTEGDKTTMNNKVFIVHGHDDGAKQTIARALERAGLEAIILHEQASGGRTIIEKIEANSNVSFAIVLYTPCDLGRSNEAQVDVYNNRARQNVVFEHGYLIGKLGRECVCALVKGDVETPGDMSGVVYITMDEKGAWKMELAKEMENAGLTISDRFYR